MVRPPIRDGWIQVADRRVIALGTGKPNVPFRDLGDAAILPALVNAHTHLEFSDLQQPLGQRSIPLPTWIAQVISHRRAQNLQPQDRVAAITRGLQESFASGVGVMGEIATNPWLTNTDPNSLRELTAPSSLVSFEMQVVAFAEALGIAEETQQQAIAWCRDCCEWSSQQLVLPPTVRLHGGISPHAPYSTPVKLVRMCVKQSRNNNLPVAMHLAESPEELEFLATKTGAFRAMLESLQLWDMGMFHDAESVADFLRVLVQAKRALVIHGNYLSTSELQFIAEHSNLSVVYCPRTHAYFGHAAYPLQRMLQMGIRVALGTDSRASNPDLNIWREAAFIAKCFPAIAPEEVLRMVTVNGADALGCHSAGRLQPGSIANLAMLPAKSEQSDLLLEELLHADSGPQIFC